MTLRLLRERGYENVRAFASARSAGRELDGGLAVEEATPEALAAGGLDLVLFSVGTSASRELVPHAVEGGALVVDKSSAYRLEDGYPLVVPEVNGDRAPRRSRRRRVVANPNCSTIPLTCVLKPLHDAAGLRRVRVSTYQAVSGAGAQRMEQLRAEPPERARPRVRLDVGGRRDRRGGEDPRRDAQDPRAARAADQRDDGPRAGPRRPRAVGLDRDGGAARAGAGGALLAGAPGVRLVDTPTPRAAAQTEDVLVGRIRPDRAAEAAASSSSSPATTSSRAPR